MVAFFSASHRLLKQLQKVFIHLWVLGLSACKDFKNWEHKYVPILQLKFEKAMDEWAPGVPEDLGSEKFSERKFKIKTSDQFSIKRGDNLEKDDPIVLACPTTLKPDKNTVSFTLKEKDKKDLIDLVWSITLKPDKNTVSFTLEDDTFYHSVTIYYETTLLLISPEAGGLQIQYHIKDIALECDNNSKRPIFKHFKIDHPVPLKRDKTQPHVTLYY